MYESVAMGAGSQANNPWLLELPDPITRACWENYLTLPKALATQMGLKVKEGKTGMVTLSVGGKTIDIPALVQPGQHPQVVGLALGWGRSVSGKAAQNIGKNGFALLGKSGNSLQYFRTGAKVSAKSESYDIAHVQTHHTVMGRPVIQEAKFDEYLKKPNAGRYYPTVETADGPVPAASLSLWKAGSVNDRPNHSWGMVIDLNSCFGCGACVVACSAENNVPVVGKQEVLNRREMHWIRIDRYYSSDAKQGDYNALEEPSDEPEVVFQPLMCQHCNNAPCETVCPVLATTHSSEGLNQMAYNRCIGTRYCANNCPYKVRRFNWFSYPKNDNFDYHVNNDLGRMVLNPDVTVRARGVIEKCSMCIQRIQEGKLFAKKEGRRPIDGEIKTACAQVCPTEAITFGDMGDPDSAISKLIAQQKQERLYYVLEEINTNPGVGYLTKIRNKA
jgi:molybdopterin-containing oxidoreductase family iron-sulfur binding subunit